jgi:hypothetical protein
MMFAKLGCNYVGECMQIWQDSNSTILSSRIVAIETKLSKILEACNSNARGIEQLSVHLKLHDKIVNIVTCMSVKCRFDKSGRHYRNFQTCPTHRKSGDIHKVYRAWGGAWY